MEHGVTAGLYARGGDALDMLYTHRSERADLLADVLSEIVAAPLGDPFSPEVVAVPTRGVERWLTQRLAHRLGSSVGRGDGVAANVDFPFPGTLVGGAVAAVSGLDPRSDPWSPERAVWPLLDVVDEHFTDPALEPLARHIVAASPERDDGALTRFAVVRRLADLFDQYAVHRPDMIRDWADPSYDPEVLGRHAWQAHLWRMLRAAIGEAGPPERLEAAAQLIRESAESLALPERLSLFGLTRLPPSYLTVLRSLAHARDVHLFLLHPSGRLWEKVSASPGGTGRSRSLDATASLPTNPLLRSWGRDSREMQLVLRAHGDTAGEYRPVEDTGPPTLLRLVQADVRADRPPPPVIPSGAEDPRPLLDDADRSIQVHSCHGRYRQVEVVRDAVLHILAADATIEPRDVIVMCPDVETYAPYVEAVFAADPGAASEGTLPDGTAARQPGMPELRVRLADRSLRQTNPMLSVAAGLLELCDARLTASQVLDFAGRDPVRTRFAFDEDDLAALQRWVIETGTRWGLDAGHREAWKLGRLTANTWEAGLARLLLGVAMAEEDQRFFEGTLPVDDVTSTSVDLVGRFAEFVERLGSAIRSMAGTRAVSEWIGALVTATEALALPAPGDGWQSEQMRGVLQESLAEAGANGRPLSAPEVRSLLGTRLRGRPTRANFRTGDLTVCTLVPMRSVPHRVICLLGLDDGSFPRHPGRDGDDIISSDPHVGDRDPRSEDRQLLLDALLAATDHLVITYSGRDERTNRKRPPSVPVAELLDVIDRTVSRPDGRPARRSVLVEHPLQAFDPRNFEAGALVGGDTWSYSAVDLAGAKAWREAAPGPRAPFLPGPLPPAGSDVLGLEALVGFVKSPVQWFLRERLGIYMNGERDEPEDSIPIEVGPLEEWGLGDRLLRSLMSGASVEEAVMSEQARGRIPPVPLSTPLFTKVVPVVETILGRLRSLPCASYEPSSMEVNLPLPDGRLLVGTVAGLRGDVIVSCVYSRLAPKHRLDAWVRLLAASACRPERSLSAVTIGRSGDSRGGVSVSEIRLGESGHVTALAVLERLVDLYDRGVREPLPLYCKTSAEWAAMRRSGSDDLRRPREAWEGNRFDGESAEPAHRLVLRDGADLNRILEEPPRPDEDGDGWAVSEASRFGRLALRLWQDLQSHETVTYG